MEFVCVNEVKTTIDGKEKPYFTKGCTYKYVGRIGEDFLFEECPNLVKHISKWEFYKSFQSVEKCR